MCELYVDFTAGEIQVPAYNHTNVKNIINALRYRALLCTRS